MDVLRVDGVPEGIMPAPRVLMLLGNAFGPDPRVWKEARSLSRNGFDVTILAWDREGEFRKFETKEGVRIRRVRVHSKSGRGLAQIPFLIAMYLSFIAFGITHAFEYIHCHDLDTLPAGTLIKILSFFRRRLIFDSHENFPVQKAYELPRFALYMLNGVQASCMPFVDKIFTASSVLKTEFEQRYRPPVVWLPNFANRDEFSIDQDSVRHMRKELGYSDDDFVIAYLGGLRPARAILPLVKAVISRPRAKLFICGGGEQAAALKSLIAGVGNVKYLGLIPQSEIIPYYFACDVLYYGLVNYPGAIYMAPNNFSYAVLSGRPMIGVDFGDLGRFLKDSGCGIAIPEASETEIGKAIDEFLNHPELLKSLKKKAKTIGPEEYHWGVVEQRLLSAYSELREV